MAEEILTEAELNNLNKEEESKQVDPESLNNKDMVKLFYQILDYKEFQVEDIRISKQGGRFQIEQLLNVDENWMGGR